ncbi:MAG: coproporphyrinogen III oxidase [Rhodospirillales bacterium]|jgi:putative oxygen-independent coproporphyrinogen III oxidase|nr:coproporphyrinogen III oxidase [Rhodospirillales bacterium]
MVQNAPGFGLYVHWPFCQSKCPYCDFNSHAVDTINQNDWQRALLQELDWAVERFDGSRNNAPTVTSIFFGGGTPSLMPPETTASIIQRIGEHFSVAPNLEITLEANPSSTETARFESFRQAGVNRLSLGIQAFNDRDLKFLGRTHDHKQALKAIETAAKIFDRYSFDLIYARPDQTPEQWGEELTYALEYAGEHLSLYQLTIEPGTAFARDGVPAAHEKIGEPLYLMTQDIMQGAGLPAYEISNHARPGAECRHNLTYWRGGEYLGIGPGAHGRLNTPSGWQAHHRIHNPAKWMEMVKTEGHGTAKQTPISAADRRDEAVLSGLRLQQGISATNFKKACGLDLKTAFNPRTVDILVKGGFLELENDGIKVTDEGRLRLDAVIEKLLND